MKKSRVRRGDSRQRKNEHDGGTGLINIMGLAQRNNKHDDGAGLASIMLWMEIGIMMWLQTGTMQWM